MADITNALNEFKTAPNGESVRDAFVEAMTLVNNDNITIAGDMDEIREMAGQLQPAAGQLQPAVSSASASASIASQKATEATNAATTATTKAGIATTASNTATIKAAEAVAAKDTAVTKAGEATTAATTVVDIRDEILPKLNSIDQNVTDATNAATLATTKASESSASAVTSSDQAVVALNAAGTATTKASEANQSAIDAAASAAEAAGASGVTPEEKAIWNAKQDALGFTPENFANKGIADGYAGLDAAGKVPLAQLPVTGSGDMLKAVYDTTDNGVVDNSEKVNGLTVETAVPSDAEFTDTIYTHPTFTEHTIGLYKIVVNNEGHVTSVTPVAKTDITDLGIPGEVVMTAEQFAATQTALSTLEYEKLSSYATNLDTNKIYVNNEWKRPDGTTYAKSTLIGTTPTYSQVKMDYYDAAGTAIINAITWNLSYDVNGFPYQRVVV